MSRRYTALAAALLACALLAACAQETRGAADAADAADSAASADGWREGDAWEIPDMQSALRDAWAGDGAGGLRAAAVALPTLDAHGDCGVPAVAAAGCPRLVGPNSTWWTGDSAKRNAFLMTALVRDNYPLVHNLGADNDDTPDKRALWQCLVRSKWLALGADRVEFYESPLNSVVVIKAGNQVFANLRGTWTQAHRDSNMEWRLGARKRVWGSMVRYHTGWGKTAEDAYAAVKTIVRDFHIPRAECTMWLSGHSRGGGAALLTAGARSRAGPPGSVRMGAGAGRSGRSCAQPSPYGALQHKLGSSTVGARCTA